MNWMSAWGIIGNPSEFKGKTIESVERLDMENVSAERGCILFKFTDGSRGWIVGRDSSHLAVDPRENSLSKSMIITPEEFAEYQRERHARRQTEKQEHRASLERQLKRIKEALESGEYDV